MPYCIEYMYTVHVHYTAVHTFVHRSILDMMHEQVVVLVYVVTWVATKAV